MSYCSAIVLAAGSGKRLKSKFPKPLINIGSKPMIVYSLETLSRHALVKEIIVVANVLNFPGIVASIKQYKIKKIGTIVLGGVRRQDSVYNGLKAINKQADLVLIHDAARPFINKKIISSVIKKAAKMGAAIVGVPVKATIKEVHGNVRVKKTLNRGNLWEIQTPQVFKKKIILEAYKKFSKAPVTDDAMLVEKLGRKINLVLGAYNNFKITTPEDLGIAKYALSNRYWL